MTSSVASMARLLRFPRSSACTAGSIAHHGHPSRPVSHFVPVCLTKRPSTTTSRRLCRAPARGPQACFAPGGVSAWRSVSLRGSVQLGGALQVYCPSPRPDRSSGLHMSLLGVGAPEALVIAVVALLVFGPKGLAEVARNIGKTLRGFQPTIKELQEVSREFRGTLEREIGLDELRDPYQRPAASSYQQPPPIAPPPPPPAPTASVSSPPQAPEAAPPAARPAAPQPQPVVSGGSPPPPAATAAAPSAVEQRRQEPAPSPGAYTTDDYAEVTRRQMEAVVTEDMKRASVEAAWGDQAPKTSPPSSRPPP